MANLNKVMLIGNLTRDPETRFTPKGTAVGEISLAINRSWNNEQGVKQEETTYVDVTLWGKTAELAQKYLTKGRPLYIEGRLSLDTWDDKDTGKKRSRLKVIADTMQFISDGRGRGDHASPPDSSGQDRKAEPERSGSPAAAAADNHDQDDIPF